MLSVSQLKEQAHECFHTTKQFASALKLYSQIEEQQQNNNEPLNPEWPLKRAACLYKLQRYDECTRLCDEIIEELNRTERADDIAYHCSKAYYQKGKALEKQRNFLEAERCFVQSMNSIINNNSTEVQQEGLTPAASKKAIARLHRLQQRHVEKLNKLVPNDAGVEVRYIGPTKGKGLFATRDFKEGDIVLDETSFIFQPKYHDCSLRNYCDHCMRILLIANDNDEDEDEDEDEQHQQQWVECGHCPTRYCSESCKQEALAMYHRVLCAPTRINALSDLLAADESDNGMAYFSAALRMIALIVQRAQDHGGTPSEAHDHVCGHHCTSRISDWIKSYVESPADVDDHFAASISMIRAALCNDDPAFARHFTPQFFDEIMGMLRMNSAQLMIKPEDSVDVPAEELEEYMNFARAIFTIHSCINHSCEPNVTAASGFDRARICVVALRDIQKGEEIMLSYIDEDLPVEQRKQQLSSVYRFECQCPRCQREEQQAE